jgi:chitodextrinase
VLRNGGIVAAALAGVVAGGVFLTAFAPGAGGESTAPDVTLQVAPRGLGSVSAIPPGLDSDNQLVSECTRNYAQRACEWRYARGTTVTLTARPDAVTGRSLASWSTADCPGTGTCKVVLDDDLTSIVALFTPLRLAIRLSNAEAGPVSTDPLGSACRGSLHDPTPDLCREFPARTRVTVTVQARSPHTFKQWSSGCEPVAPGSCAITVLDEATWVGASFDDDRLPVLPTTIRVQFRLRKRGDGSGRVTASNLDCGSHCGERYEYGTSLTLTAVPDSGSVFDGWNDRVCAPTRTRCTVPVGPITAIAARFARPPRAPARLRVTRRTRTSITVSWSASSGGARVTGYRVYLNGAVKGRTAKRTYKLRGLRCGRRYRIAVDAVDARRHRSGKRSTRARTAPCARR